MDNNIQKLSLERNDKLKLFAIVSARTTFPKEMFKDNFALCLMASYTEAEAMMGVGQAIKTGGYNISDFNLGVMKVGVDLEKIIDLPLPLTEISKDEKIEVVNVDKPKQTLEEHMIANVRQMFNLVGNDGENKIAEQVIKRFNDYAQVKK